MGELEKYQPQLPEKGQEKIPDKEGVMEIITRFGILEGADHGIETEDYDALGLVCLEVRIPVGLGYQIASYLREGKHGKGREANEHRIDVVSFDSDDIPDGGFPYAKFDKETGEWVKE